jgi:hypothetical protein
MNVFRIPGHLPKPRGNKRKIGLQTRPRGYEIAASEQDGKAIIGDPQGVKQLPVS